LKQKFYTEFERLSANPFKHQNVKKIRNTEFGYRLRIGRWRILFALFSKEKQIEIVDIFLKKGRENYFKRKRLIS
jgi:mRNA-degrading endonuclease RelE of RelBE toxin-antitoxin system